jgi:hypothetical protein
MLWIPGVDVVAGTACYRQEANRQLEFVDEAAQMLGGRGWVVDRLKESSSRAELSALLPLPKSITIPPDRRLFLTSLFRLHLTCVVCLGGLLRRPA